MARALCAAMLAGGLLLALARADAGEPSDCLPADLKLRVAFAEPKRLAEALRELEAERKLAGKREVLRRRFAEAGCARVDEQPGEGFAEPNLVCRIPGASEGEIAIGASLEFDGLAAAALLPELARAVAAAPRAHGYAIALLSRGATTTPVGARAFADSFGARPPRAFLHVGMVGTRVPDIGPEAGETERCWLASVSQAVLGAPLARVTTWDQVSVQCVSTGGNRYSGGTESLRTCSGTAFTRFLDVDPFAREDVPVAGVYAYPKRDRTNFARAEPPRFDPAAWVATYRVVAAYAVALDTLLAAPPDAVASPAVPAPPAP